MTIWFSGGKFYCKVKTTVFNLKQHSLIYPEFSNFVRKAPQFIIATEFINSLSSKIQLY